jgi:hypothetical protein
MRELVSTRGFLGRGQIQPYTVTHFLDEERIRGQLETRLPMGLQAEQLKEALYRANCPD